MSRDFARTLLPAILLIAGLLLAWQVSGTLLIIFAGLLIAALLDAMVMLLGKVLPIGRPWRLLIVVLVLTTGIGAALVMGGMTLWVQLRDLVNQLIESWEDLAQMLEGWGVPLPTGEGRGIEAVLEWIENPQGLLGTAGTLFGTTFGFVGDLVIVVFLGLFFAINPQGYRNGFLLLVAPAHRARVGEVLDKTGFTLRWWLVGQVAMMILVGVSVWLLLLTLGIDNALLLGLIVGSLNFIPFLGPILGIVPVFLAVLGSDLSTILLAMGLYLVIQNVEGYLISPFVQERVVHLAPGWSLSVLAVMGALFGGLGVALATPLFAVTRVLVLELYVRDVLEKRTRTIVPP